ncbi:hypothetical protein A2U01_0062506, partial [Trifolium medium]|nr:hypothetical protein [Trifolium medium]
TPDWQVRTSLKKHLVPTIIRILDSSTSSTTLRLPKSSFRSPRSIACLQLSLDFRIALQAFTTLRPPEMPSVCRSLAWPQTNLGTLGGSTSCNIKLLLHPTTSSSPTSSPV